MAEKIVMLALSPTMETGTIVKWLKKEGEHISSGDVLCEVETDKATMDYESTFDGNLLKIVAEGGSKVKVGDLIAIAGNPGESITPLLVSGNGKRKESKENKRSPQQTQVETKEETSPQKEMVPEKIKASPLAKEIAREKGIDLRSVTGSGPNGRIVKEDIESFAAKKAVSVEQPPVLTRAPMETGKEERVPISEKRKVIAQRLSTSMYTSPHYYMTTNVIVDLLLNARAEMNARSKTKISLNSFFIKFVAEALRRHPVINSTWEGDTIVHHKSIDIALAVALSDGLITPVVRNCGQKGILSIDSELKSLVERARDGKLQYEEYSNAYFTISNLGSYGVRSFTAIINPPGSAILAIGEVFKDPYFDEKGSISSRSCIAMTLSCDHRVIDGAVAAEFAKDLKSMIENPITILY